MKSSRFELLDHTGDLGLEIWSDSEIGIFEAAARGLFSIVCNIDRVEPRLEETIKVEGPSSADLLVSWLTTLNLKATIDGILFCEFSIDKYESKSLTATVKGERIIPKKHSIKREVKAVTYHGLRFERHELEWYAQVVFDL